jgi:membrane protease YdiL (CAAX protease family)
VTSIRTAGWRFIDLAALGVNSARAYVAAGLRIVLIPSAVATVLALLGGGGAAGLALGQYAAIVVAGIVVIRVTVRVHRRPWRSLIAPDLRIDWRRLAIGAGAELVILSAQLGIAHVVGETPWSFTVPAEWPVLLVAALLIPLQAASEEIWFRGYLTQAFGRVVRSRVLIALIVGIIFGALHLGIYGPFTIPYFLMFSLVYSAVSLRDDRLELVIGGHAMANWFAFGTASTMLAGAGIDSSALRLNAAALGVMLVHGALFYGLTRLGLRLFSHR